MGIRDKIKGNLGAGQPPMISRQGNRFTLRDAAGNELQPQATLDVIIVDGNGSVSKVYRADRNYNPNDPTPPDCFSDNGVAPSVMALKPQHATCIDCPHNARGSDISRVSGKAIKACSDNQKLAVIVVDAPEQSLYQLLITPGSLTNFRNYDRELQGHRYDLNEVVTRLDFDPKQLGVLTFATVGLPDEEETKLVASLDGSSTARFVTGEDDTPIRGALPAPDNVRQISTGLPRADAATGMRRDDGSTRDNGSRQTEQPVTHEQQRAHPLGLAPGPTREQLQAVLEEKRAEAPKPRGRPPKAKEPNTLQQEVDALEAQNRTASTFGQANATSAAAEIPAFLPRKGGMVPNPSPPPADVTRLLDQQKGTNVMEDRLAKAFALPTRG